MSPSTEARSPDQSTHVDPRVKLLALAQAGLGEGLRVIGVELDADDHAGWRLTIHAPHGDAYEEWLELLAAAGVVGWLPSQERSAVHVHHIASGGVDGQTVRVIHLTRADTEADHV